MNTLMGNFSVKRFKSKKEVLKQNTIFIFCPENRTEELQSILEEYEFELVFNDYSIKDFSLKVICHFESTNLSKTQKDYLVKATELGAWVEPLVSYLDNRLGFTEVQLLQSNYFLHQKAFSILSVKKTQVAKRFIDVLSAILLILLTLPIGILFAILIKLESRGPIFYKQTRTGQYNEEFEVIKFRSMSRDAEADGAQWAQANDSRVTKVGRFIRKTRIDELPQFINVLRGEMSMVGPRPEREVFITELEKEIPYYRFRHAVKPGVTGLAQISYPYGASVEDAIWKHKYDIHYIKHHSTFGDLKIMFKTIKVVLFGLGR
ncbi:exopolysaccharide biosynthesis polyprenyl glycosylphosphotransferase [Pseudoalteromonas sp. LC2018020214]|uniref:exopolysaccharide biosynthesis polyprenyl glycosylphosphotransferase n=1 Tax=Pseudoalteromonas sp. LC2018020214 TaxID=2799564 RepID=UPI00190624E7|nr:exopolysaccharide biosynthesis polyprenyl glycosylphosphotransferase [Pseudoalteromonas sp. LC2018020214]QQM64724.1 exopolysaccharide biosynthesis polyprenyl glycosylphosphotransferase [Pseudoalteromonas sp. LC2018020214]